ncbi:hypothetical protein [Streptomyces xantholiticus]|uniref:Uncharacterized protein n=1 Tax=Streptomyces xantholiticus TaxID=68285 RepID=A0ABV1UZU8_9ACTN
MTRPGHQELAREDLAELLGGELPSTLPLEGWRKVTLHCQVDAIGPSERHPDLVKLELSFPPAKAPEPPCKRCRGSKVVPDFKQWDKYHGEPKPVPCPECSACSATSLHAVAGRVRCGLPAGHYDEENRPGAGEPFSQDPGGWHQSLPDREGIQLCWSDQADGATPHGAGPEPTVGRPLQRVGINCPTCGPTTVEEHPRRPGMLRCVDCREHLGRGHIKEQTS